MGCCMTLIEVLVYLMVSGMVLLGMHTIVFTVQRCTTELMAREDDLIKLACARAAFVRDLQHVSRNKVLCSRDRVIFHKESDACAWWVQGRSLIRACGVFGQSQKFITRSRSLIASSVTSFSCRPLMKKNQLVGIHCTMKSLHHELSTIIALEDHEDDELYYTK